MSQQRLTSLPQARAALALWLQFYNEARPHSSLDYLTPKEFADLGSSVVEPNKDLLALKRG